MMDQCRQVEFSAETYQACANRGTQYVAVKLQTTFVNVPPDAFSELEDRVFARVRYQNEEFVSAITHQNIRLPYTFLCTFHYELKHCIACRVPKAVVDELEPVDIEDDDACRFTRAQRVLADIQEFSSIRDSGQRIQACQSASLFQACGVTQP